ncbi:MAG: response regulator transcription factor [Bacteroidia bacterium]
MEHTPPKILVVDDEPDILEFIGYNLKKEGYEVSTAVDGLDALKKAHQHQPDLILLDIMMPKLDGIAVCQELRGDPQFKKTLIVFLTALGDEQSEIKGLNTGADDYVSKPIKPKLLLTRISALLRRGQKDDISMHIHVGDLHIDRERHNVRYKDQEFSMPRKEFELLSLLASQPGKVFNRDEIMTKVWGNDVIVGDRTIDVHVRKLRQKLGDETIKTIKGIGYKFEP